MSLQWILIILAVLAALFIGIDYRRHRKKLKLEQDLLQESTVTSQPEPVSQDTTDEVETGPSAKITQPQLLVSDDLVVIHLLADQGFLGATIINALLNHGLHLGDKSFFHRYQQVNGSGSKLFSVVTACEPGTFDTHNIATKIIPGIIFFLSFNDLTEPVPAFELMLRTAKQICFAVGGRLLDENKEVLTLHKLAMCRRIITEKAELSVDETIPL